MKTDFNSRLKILMEEHRKLLERKNERIEPGNGIFHRYKNPVLTGDHAPLVWSMYADAADYSEWKTGRRATGLVFSASSMSQKFGWTIGGALAGWLLGYYGFKANVVQTVEAQTGIKMMLSFFPAIGTLAGAFFMFIYPLSEKKMVVISSEVSERREKAKSE